MADRRYGQTRAGLVDHLARPDPKVDFDGQRWSRCGYRLKTTDRLRVNDVLCTRCVAGEERANA